MNYFELLYPERLNLRIAILRNVSPLYLSLSLSFKKQYIHA